MGCRGYTPEPHGDFFTVVGDSDARRSKSIFQFDGLCTARDRIMSIYRYGNQFFTPRCDYCGKVLPMEMSGRMALKAMQRAGWERRAANGEIKDICTDCLFEEKNYEET